MLPIHLLDSLNHKIRLYYYIDFIDCFSSANAAPEFEGRGGEDLATSISGLLERLYSSPLTFDTSKLCIVPGKHVKAYYVDVEVCMNSYHIFSFIHFILNLFIDYLNFVLFLIVLFQ